MRIPEILAPAGNMAAFKAALAAGADAIYVGLGNRFNARRGADNFDAETLAEACTQAHVAGAAVYVTTNVAIQESEMDDALELLYEAARAGVDGYIIQDWGLAAEALTQISAVETHISTQANINDARGAAWAAKLGASRVTLSRELSLPEIARIAEEPIECECFAHGALCFCYSGLCMMSAMRGSRSANRGLCAQPCRLPHVLVKRDGTRVGPVAWERGLCPKDAKSTQHLAELMDAGVAALKLEGRMKAPDYVFAAVSSYRETLDHVLATGEAATLPHVERRLKRAFNRDFTDAYLMGRSGNELMSYERSNNRGQLVGEITRMRGKVATLNVTEPVGEGDLLELRPTEAPDQFLCALCPGDVAAGASVEVELKRPLSVGTPVRVLRSQALIDTAKRAAKAQIARKRAITVSVRCVVGEPLTIQLEALPTLHGARAQAKATGPVVEPAKTRALTRQDLIEHVGRMGQTPFSPIDFDIELGEGAGLGFSTVHRVRNEAVQALIAAILQPYKARAAAVLAPVGREKRLAGLEALKRFVAARVGRDNAASAQAPADEPAPKPGGAAASEVRALVASPEAACAALDAGATTVYASAEALAQGRWPEATVPLLDEVCREADARRQDRWIQPGKPVAVGAVSELARAAEVGAQAEVRGCIPVHNSSCIATLEAAGAEAFWLSPELTLAQIKSLSTFTTKPLGLVVYGNTRTMTSEHCVLAMSGACAREATGKQEACATCKMRGQELFLENIDGRRLPVKTDLQGRSRIWWSEPLDAVPYLDRVIDAGITWLGVDCTLLDAQETSAAVARVVAARGALLSNKDLPEALPNTTQGHLMRPVD